MRLETPPCPIAVLEGTWWLRAGGRRHPGWRAAPSGMLLR